MKEHEGGFHMPHSGAQIQFIPATLCITWIQNVKCLIAHGVQLPASWVAWVRCRAHHPCP